VRNSGAFGRIGHRHEVTVAEYRNGNEKENHVRKVPGIHKNSDITLKRGIINSKSLWDWIKQVRTTGVNAQKGVTVTLLDEARTPVQTGYSAASFQ
jgi:phage tail-like protein